jgi:hypothetical protein
MNATIAVTKEVTTLMNILTTSCSPSTPERPNLRR